MNNIKFYGIEFMDGADTTTGQPHAITGRMNHAADILIFNTKIERDTWVSDGGVSRGGRVPTNRYTAKARYFAGDTLIEFDERLEMSEFEQQEL